MILTIIFVMLAEVFIFVPSVARFREDYLLARLERAQIASLALLASEGMITEELEDELLINAEVLNVVLRRDSVRQLILSMPNIPPVSDTFDLRDATAWELIRDAMRRLLNPEAQTIRVIGEPLREAGLQIEITMYTAPLRAAILDYGLTILMLSAVISVFTALLLFVAVRFVLVVPIKRLVSSMVDYAGDPNDANKVIVPREKVIELRDAEEALNSLQTQLTSALKQRERLAQLGEAVARISHDLRNMLSVATLVADRLEMSEDPTVKRIAPKLINSLNRAINLTEATLAFGRAEEPAPKLSRLNLRELVDDVLENDKLSAGESSIRYACTVPADVSIRADAEQLHRVLSNLVRNARQAMETSTPDGEIRITGEALDTGWCIKVSDTGPGLPKKALDHLFEPFQGNARKGGTGLGLAICAELIRGHGGQLKLAETGDTGTTFAIFLPAGSVA